MKASYARFWRMFFLGLAALFWWEEAGRAWMRRRSAPKPPAAEERTQPHFTAVLFPKITSRREPYALSRKEFEQILKGLKSRGFTPVGLEDVRALYGEGRRLPPHALLIALDRDEPRSVVLADKVMRRAGMKGVVFLSGRVERTGRYKRHWLSRHAIRQYGKSGIWEFGDALPSFDPGIPPEEFTARLSSGPALRFLVSPSGLNDHRRAPEGLNIMRVRPGNIEHIVATIHNDQPRETELLDRFASERLGPQWLTGWGAVSTIRKKLMLVPTPRQTGASVFLTGTEGWDDMSLEFELERFQKNFWAYARYKDAGHYVRVGATDKDKAWMVQQRTGPLAAPVLLGKAELPPGSLPTTVRLVLKGGFALVYLNGVRQFGRALRLDPAVDRGRVQLGTYDKDLRAAFAVVRYVRAKPLGGRWIALTQPLGEAGAARLRHEAVEASALSPRWLRLSEGGAVSELDGPRRDSVWSFAAYYGCRVLPMVELRARSLSGKALERAADELARRAEEWNAAGLNLALAPGARPDPALLAAVRKRLAADKRELWITSHAEPDPLWASAVDGALRPEGDARAGLEPLTRLDLSSARAMTASAEVR